ncbi:MAG: four helix bundle suffix domain-containing protein [Rhodothermales bacterium]
MSTEPLLPRRGGYRHLKSFQVARVCYDVTVRFCDRYISRFSRTHDQMVQAARSGVQNIAEGSMASATSKKTEMKLTNVARASLAELRLDYEDYLRQRRLSIWPSDDPRRDELVARRCQSADEVAAWVAEVCRRGGAGSGGGQVGRGGLTRAKETERGNHARKRRKRNNPSLESPLSTRGPTPDEAAANAAIVLINVATGLLRRQLDALAATFTEEGGFTERLYRARKQRNRRR